MKDMHISFDFEGNRGFDFNSQVIVSSYCSDPNIDKWGVEPSSVLENIASPNPPNSSSTLGSTDTATLAAVSGPQHESINAAGVQQIDTKCGLGMEDWETVLSESPATQQQSVLGWIMGDAEDPLNKVLADPDFGFNAAMDQALGGLDTLAFPHKLPPNPPNPMFFPNNLGSVSLNQTPFATSEPKPHIYNTQMLINQHQAHNPPFFLPVSNDHNYFVSPHSKRHNSGNLESTSPIPKAPFLDSGQQHSFLGIPNYQQQQRSSMLAGPKFVGDELGLQQLQQQSIIDQLYKASELFLSGNVILLQGILARLNHQLSPIGKPFHRSAYYCKEALQLLLQTHNNMNPSSTSNSPFNLIFKIGAYKSFSEISPVLQFANFTCNQALLEATDGFDQIHIIDFDIGYGGQWASFMQELAFKNCGVPSLKITAFASPSTAHDQLELGLTRENLNHFASEINMAFEFEIVSLDTLNSTSWSLPLHVLESEAVAVNLPAGSFFNQQVSLPLVLRFIKQLSPKIVVSADMGCDRNDLPFPNHVIHAVQSYTNLLESLDAVNLNHDALNKIERFLLQPGFEKIVMDRYRSPEKSQHWRTLFLSSGFSPLTFSNFTESQAECVVKRTPVRGFHVEKRQSCLVLYWQRRELISVSAWRC